MDTLLIALHPRKAAVSELQCSLIVCFKPPSKVFEILSANGSLISLPLNVNICNGKKWHKIRITSPLRQGWKKWWCYCLALSPSSDMCLDLSKTCQLLRHMPQKPKPTSKTSTYHEAAMLESPHGEDTKKEKCPGLSVPTSLSLSSTLWHEWANPQITPAQFKAALLTENSDMIPSLSALSNFPIHRICKYKRL